MSIIFLGLLSFAISSIHAAEIEHVTKGIIFKNDSIKEQQEVALLQQSSWMKEVNKLNLDIQKVICRSVKLMLIDDLAIDRQLFLDAEPKFHKDSNEVNALSLLWHYHAVQHYMSQNNPLKVGIRQLCLHDALQLSSEQRNLMVTASKSNVSPLSYWDYMKLQKVSPTITKDMTLTINRPTFFNGCKCIGSTRCLAGPTINGMLCCMASLTVVPLACGTGCHMVPTGTAALTFLTVLLGYNVCSCCCCKERVVVSVANEE